MAGPTAKDENADLIRGELFSSADGSTILSRSSSLSDNHSDCSSGTEAASLRHMKVAEAAVTGWEKATAESMALKVQLEQALQLKHVSDRKAARLDLALKESIRELRRVREEQAQRIRDAVAEKKGEWDKHRADLEARLQGYEGQLTEANTELEAMAIVLEDRASVIRDMEAEANRYTDLLKRAEAARVKLEEKLDSVMKEVSKDAACDKATILKSGEEICCEGKDDAGEREPVEQYMLGNPSRDSKGQTFSAPSKSVETQVDSETLPCLEVALQRHNALEQKLAVAERKLRLVREQDVETRPFDQRLRGLGDQGEALQNVNQLPLVDNYNGDSVEKNNENILKQGNSCIGCQGLLSQLLGLQEELGDVEAGRHSREEAAGLLEGELAKMKSRLTKAEGESVAALREVASLKEELALGKKEMDRLVEELSELRRQEKNEDVAEEGAKEALILNVPALNEQFSDLPRELRDSQERSQLLAAELALAQADAAHLRGEIGRLSNEVATVESKGDEDLAIWRGKSTKLAGDLAEAEAEIAKIRAEISERQACETRVEQDLREALMVANQKTAEVSAELAQSRQETADLGEELASLEEMVAQLSDGLAEKESLKTELTAAHVKVEELSAELSSWREQTSGLQAALASAQSAITDLSRELGGKDDILAELAASKKRIAELSAELGQWRNDTISLGSELTLAKNRIAELADAESEAGRLRSQLLSSKSRITEANEAVMSADADKEDMEEELLFSRAVLAEVAEQGAGQRKEITDLEAELMAIKQGDARKALELEARRLARKTANRSQELKSQTNEYKTQSLLAVVGKEREEGMQELHELRLLKAELTSELSSTARWTAELESRLEEEGRAKEHMQAEITRLRTESAVLSSRLVAATERASMLEASLMETESRVAEVRRSLVGLHKEKLTADMDLAVANAARAELGSRLDLASNEVNALSAKLAALVEDGHLDRERREESRDQMSQEASSSIESTSSRGRSLAHKEFIFLSSKRQLMSQLSHPSSSQFVFGRVPSQAASPKKTSSDHSQPRPSHPRGAAERMDGAEESPPPSSHGENSVEQPMAEQVSPRKGRRSNGEGSPRSSAGKRATSPRNRREDSYYNTPLVRRSRGKMQFPSSLDPSAESDLPQQSQNLPLVGGKRNVISALGSGSRDMELASPGQGVIKQWPSKMGQGLDKMLSFNGSPPSSCSSQDSQSPSQTPSSVLPQAPGSGFFGSMRRSPFSSGSKGGQPVHQTSLHANLPSVKTRVIPLSRSSSLASFLGRSKRVRADALRE